MEYLALAIPDGQLSHDWRSSLDAIRIAVVLLALVFVAVMAYRAGYVRGQDELLYWHRSTAAERNAVRTKGVLPRWRRLAGWAAYGCAGLLNCLFLGLAFLYARRWGWAILLAVWTLWFALFVGAIWLAERCWQPYRAALDRLRAEQAEIFRALDGRDSKENSP